MKKMLVLVSALLINGNILAQEEPKKEQAQTQEQSTENQQLPKTHEISTTPADSLVVESGIPLQKDNDALHEHITELKKKSDKFNVYLNFQVSADAVSEKGKDTQVGFKARHLRLEFRGDLTDKIFYRFRHRLNRSNAAASLDNLARATDMMYAGFRVTDKLAIVAGKLLQDWGGYEFDYNPIYVYEFSDFGDNMDPFMIGGKVSYVPNDNHEFNINITDSRNNKFEDIYGGRTGINGIEPSGTPLTYIFNWNGNFFNKKLQTRWAAGYIQEAKNYGTKMLTLGTKLNLSKFQAFFDYMRSDEDLDRLQYAKAIGTDEVLKDVTYNTYILKAEYQFAEKWNVFARGMLETTKIGKLPVGALDTERKSFGYLGGLEFSPFKDQDLKFFAIYVGRKYDYKHDNSLDTSTNRFSLGMVYRIKPF